VTDVRLFLFQGGWIELPRRNVELGTTEGNEMLMTPVTWFVITHPRGNVIVDGGNAPEVAIDARAHWGPIMDTSTAHFTADEALLPSLERAGIERESIRWVVQSHLHIDHTGALAVIHELPNAQVLATRTEYEFAHAPPSVAALGYCQADFVKPGIDWALIEETDDGYDLFGDGSLRCWRTPGHSPGHQSIEVRLGSGERYLLAVDAAVTLDHLEERLLPGFSLDMLESVRSVRKLRRLAWRSEATVIAGHDPIQWPTLDKAPSYYS
jgi:glyoxylase-like metal-dependent hydrolase (beta-lactamase superfamily II)